VILSLFSREAVLSLLAEPHAINADRAALIPRSLRSMRKIAAPETASGSIAGAFAKRLITRITRSETRHAGSLRRVDHRCVRHAIRSSTEVLFAE
jgi:hypothetical protein